MPAGWHTAPAFQSPAQPARRTTLTRMGHSCLGLQGVGGRAGLAQGSYPSPPPAGPRHRPGASPYLKDVPPDVVAQRPAQAMQDVEHLLLLQDAEQTVQQDLEPHGHCLRAVEHQAADVEHHVGLHDLHLGGVVQVLRAELVQGCGGPAGGPGAAGRQIEKGEGRDKRKEKPVTGSYGGLGLHFYTWMVTETGRCNVHSTLPTSS